MTRAVSVYILFFLSLSNSDKTCSLNQCSIPNVCSCHLDKSTSEIRADCSMRFLKDVPSFSDNVTWINLSGNNIVFFPGKGKLPSNLKYLNINSNSITGFENESFSHLTELVELFMQDNIFPLNSKTFPKNILQGLTKLRRLKLKDNTKMKDGVFNYPDAALSSCISLEDLEIDGLEGKSFGIGFKKLKFLKRLDMSGINGHCTIKHLQAKTFKTLLYIEFLDLSFCEIIAIEKNTFSAFPHLKIFNISYNNELTFGVLKNITTDLRFTQLEVFHLEHIHCTYGLGTELYVDDMSALQNMTTLKDISFASNRLELIESGFVGILPKFVEIINVGDNKITKGRFELELQSLQHLKTINISLQFMSHQPHTLIEVCDDSKALMSRYCGRLKNGNSSKKTKADNFPLKNLRENNLQQKLIATNSPHLDFTSSVFAKRKDNTKHSFLSKMPKKGSNSQHRFPSINFPIPLPPRLEVIYFNSSGLQFEAISLKMSKNMIREIYLQNNIIYKWTGPYNNLEHVQVLDLSDNFCRHVSSVFFDAFVGLRTLRVSNNMLGSSIKQDVKGLMLKNLLQLRYLDLSRNEIYSIPNRMFHNSTSIEVLNLSHNFLQNLHVMLFSKMSKLRYLDLRSNQVGHINNDLRHTFGQLFHKSNLTIDLADNTQLCICEKLEYLLWLKRYNMHFKDFNNYKCIFANGTIKTMQHLDEIVRAFRSECKSYTALVTVTSCVLFVAITVIISGVIYRYRWKLRYLYYMAKGKYHGYYDSVPSEKSNFKYMYDAFVSYADEDRQLAFFDMIKYLEVDGDIKLCLHHRDFIAGFDIAENITKAIHNSRKFVCIISETYLKSYWCMFEVNMARMESIYSRDGQNIMFLVLTENNIVRSLPMSLMNLIEDKTYIEYPNDPQGNVVFWDKIKRALK